MGEVELVSAFGRDGIEVVHLERQPARGTVGRHPFPLLDLRTRSEAEYEAAAKPHPFGRHVAWLRHHFAEDLPLKEDPLFRAGPVMIFRGSVWFRNEPVLGSVHARQVAELGQWQKKVRSFENSPTIPRYPGTTAIIQAPGARNYFHWMIEVSPRLLALREYLRQGAGPLDRVLLFYDGPARFITESIEFLYPDLAGRIEYSTKPLCALENCLFFTDQTRYENHNSRWKPTTAFLSEEIDDQLAALPPRQGPGRAILVTRTDAPTRRLVNEDLLLEAFAPEGLERVAFGDLHLRDQMKVMADARLVMGVHGAGMTNLLFCRPGTAVVEFTSTQYIRRCRSFADIAMHRRLPYALAVLDQHGDKWVIEQNRGNDLELAEGMVPTLRETVTALMRQDAAAETV